MFDAIGSFFSSIFSKLKWGKDPWSNFVVKVLKLIGPMVGTYIMDQTIKKIDGLEKKKNVRDQLAATFSQYGINLPDSIMEFSIEEQYQNLKASGKIPSKDYSQLEKLLPVMEEAVTRVLKDKEIK